MPNILLTPTTDTEAAFQNEGEPKQNLNRRKGLLFLPLVCACMLIIIGAIATGITIAAKKGAFSSKNGDSGGDSGSTSSVQVVPLPVTCPVVPSSKRFVMFWQTEQAGCDTIPDGVTHLVLGFSLVGKGNSETSLEFQESANIIKSCISSLHKRCIKVMGSVGGASNVENMATISNYQVFATSVLALMKEFSLDGVDIDDETVGTQYSKSRVEGYMKVLFSTLKTGGNNYLISFDGLAYEGNDTICTTPSLAPYVRCLPDIANYVDWVNVLVYNVNNNANTAATIYSTALHDLVAPFEVKLGSRSKVTIGVCEGGGCAYGPGPSNAIIKSWTQYSKQVGGMMIYAGSSDVLNKYSLTLEILQNMK